MKKLISAAILLGMVVSVSVPTAFASTPVKVLVDNKTIQMDTAPILEKGRVLIPIRGIAESLDADVDWDAKAKTVTVRKWSRIAHLTAGKKAAAMEGNRAFLDDTEADRDVELDVPVRIDHNRVYIPLRAISQIFGYDVQWKNNTVFIQSLLSTGNVWAQGNLAESRKFAMKIVVSDALQCENEPLPVTRFSEDYDQAFLFPEGEALRFYYIFGDTVSFIQLKDGFPVVVWQAHLPEGDNLQQLLNGNFSDQRGTAPSIDKAFLYYGTGFFGDSSHEESGFVDADGNFSVTAYTSEVGGQVKDQKGIISLELPGEKRNEAIEFK